MISRTVRLMLLLLCSATACFAQVNLDIALPATGTAGDTIDNLLGSGFPAGNISAATVNVSIASTCNGAGALAVTPFFITPEYFGFRAISFALPATLPAGKYAISVKGATASGATFATSGCAWFTVRRQTKFVTARDGQLMLGRQPFHFSGADEAGLNNTSPAMTTQMLQVAAENQLQALRVWGFIDIGNQNGSNSVDGIVNGYYYQYWNGSAPAYNDGPTGLQNLDYSLYQAGLMGFKVVLTMTNNWTPNGGMDQYVAWAGDQYHDQFYTDAKIRAWYEAWVSHLLNHVNYYTGKAYKDDPTIMIVELANEPRCQGTGDYPASSSCTTSTLGDWVTAESAYVKSVDPNHLVAVGDEGWFCVPGSTDANNGCSLGDDAVAFASAPGIDAVTLHLYSQVSGSDTTWGTDYIKQHIQLGKALGKPTYVGEYGLQAGDQRNIIYNEWQQTVLHNGGAGALVWDIGAGQPGAIAAEADNSLDLYDQAPLLHTIRNFAQEAEVGQDMMFVPSADDQWATTTLNTPTTLNPLQNVLTYGSTTVNMASLNLNPGGAQQSSVHVFGGQFALADGAVSFSPDNDFNGKAVVPFTVRDSKGDTSNTAYLIATVEPTPSVTYEIESFETGADGWQGTGDTTSQSTLYATNGPHSLKVVAGQTGWFGIQFSSAISLANRPNLSLDIVDTGTSASTDLVIQAGSNYQWCQSNAWPWLNANQETTITMPLTPAGTGCASPDLGQIDGIYVYLVAGNTYYIDNVQAGPVPVGMQPIDIFDFEAGTDGWGPQSSGGGTVAQENTFYTSGSYGLEVTATGSGGWFGTDNMGTLDLSSKSGISYDIDTPNNGTSVNMELVYGPSSTVCTGTNWGWADSSDSTQTIPFSTLSCPGGSAPDLTQVTGLWLYFSAGTYYIDYVRAQ
jgi:mannan endo-1,4-beta-mannosidase